MSSAADSWRIRTSKRRILWPAIALVGAFAAFAYWFVHRPLPAPRITQYEQLTLDGREKVALGTDGTRIYMAVWSSRRKVSLRYQLRVERSRRFRSIYHLEAAGSSSFPSPFGRIT